MYAPEWLIFLLLAQNHLSYENSQDDPQPGPEAFFLCNLYSTFRYSTFGTIKQINNSRSHVTGQPVFKVKQRTYC